MSYVSFLVSLQVLFPVVDGVELLSSPPPTHALASPRLTGSTLPSRELSDLLGGRGELLSFFFELRTITAPVLFWGSHIF